MDAPSDDNGIDLPVNCADSESEPPFPRGVRGVDTSSPSSTRAADEPSALQKVRIDLPRSSLRRTRLPFVPPPPSARATSDTDGSQLPQEDDRLSGSHSDTRFSNPLPPAVRRVAVHRVRKAADTPAAERYGVFLYDTAGHEHALAQFDDAASAGCAALRLGQTYRVGVEFGNFSDPKAMRRLRD